MLEIGKSMLPTRAHHVKSNSGCDGAVCKDCRRADLLTEKTISNGLKIIRLRFGLHRGELPFLGPSDLKIYLLSLLAGPGKTAFKGSKVRHFPRIQRGWDADGFPIFHRLSRVHRWELAHSCASLARCLPPSCRQHSKSMIDDWTASATSSPPPSSPEYLRFCKQLVKSIFPLGWDFNRYQAAVDSFAPKASARAESKGAPGLTGSSYWTEYAPEGYSSKSLFRRLTLKGKGELPERCGFNLRVKEIPTVGKMRVIGIPTVNYDVLGPLHRAVYGHLTSTDWLVHGKISSQRVSKVCIGKVQTSVDLVNATDGLRLDVTETILAALLAKTSTVPGQVKTWAHQALYPTFRGGSVSKGQMMGTYMSFPLLCLHSYCAASWAARNSVLRGICVNGDDVIISHDLPLGSYPEGYELNFKKTITASHAAELNSTVFLRSSRGWKEVRNLRKGGAETDFKGIRHMADACRSAGPSWVSAFIRSKIGKTWSLSAEDLGLHCSHALVYNLHRRQMGGGSRVRFPVARCSERYRMVDYEPSLAQKVAFGIDLFDNGRDVSTTGEFNPSRSQVLKTCGPRYRTPWIRSRGARFGAFRSYESYLAEKPEVSTSRWMVLSEENPLYQEKREEENVDDERSRLAWRHWIPEQTERSPFRLVIPDLSRLRKRELGENGV